MKMINSKYVEMFQSFSLETICQTKHHAPPFMQKFLKHFTFFYSGYTKHTSTIEASFSSLNICKHIIRPVLI